MTRGRAAHEPTDKPPLWRLIALAILGSVAVAYLIRVLFLPASDLAEAGTAFLLLIVVCAIFASDILSRLEQFSLSNSSLSARFRHVEERQDDLARIQQGLDEQISRLKFVLSHLLTYHEAKHLRKLAGDEPYRFRRQKTFDVELRRLRDLGYIQPADGYSGGVGGLPNQGDDLRVFFILSGTGWEHLRLMSEEKPVLAETPQNEPHKATAEAENKQ